MPQLMKIAPAGVAKSLSLVPTRMCSGYANIIRTMNVMTRNGRTSITVE